MDEREPTRLNPPEPPNVMLGSNPYGSSLQSSSMMVPNSAGQGLGPGMRLSFNSSAPSPASRPAADTSGMLYHGDNAMAMRPAGGLNTSEPMKKKRGRPRKYGPDGSMGLALSPLSGASGYTSPQSSESSAKRRGRPPGSGKKQHLEAFGPSGNSFTPHVITVKGGEDVSSKIMAFSQQGPRTVCILSANGVISNVSLRQPASSGGTVAYEGRFEIISLSGSFLLTENDGIRSRTGGLSVALAGSDGRVLGGVVAGMLLAAAPVQVVVGSFNADAKKPKPPPMKPEPTHVTPQPPPGPGGAPPSETSPPSQGTLSLSSEEEDDDDGDGDGDGGGSSLNHNHNAGAYHNSGQHVQNMSSYTSHGWPPSINQHRQDTDMKMMPN